MFDYHPKIGTAEEKYLGEHHPGYLSPQQLEGRRYVLDSHEEIRSFLINASVGDKFKITSEYIRPVRSHAQLLGVRVTNPEPSGERWWWYNDRELFVVEVTGKTGKERTWRR